MPFLKRCKCRNNICNYKVFLTKFLKIKIKKLRIINSTTKDSNQDETSDNN